MNTINRINAIFEELANDHAVLKGFYTHRVDELDADKVTLDKYPLLYCQVTNAMIHESFVEYDYELIVADYVNEEHEQNLTRVYNDTLILMQDIVAQFVFSAVAIKNPIVSSVDTPINCDPFTARFSNLLTGWSTTLTIRTPLPLTLCDIPWE